MEHAPLDSGTEALVTATIDCAMTVHKTLGPGFLERPMNEHSFSSCGLREFRSKPSERYGSHIATRCSWRNGWM